MARPKNDLAMTKSKTAPTARYTPEFKQEAVRLVDGGQRIVDVAKMLDLSGKTLLNWVKASRNGKKFQDNLLKTVSFRLSDVDHAAYLAKVEASGMSSAAFFRECVMTNKTQVIAQPKTSQDKARLLYLFNKASNNMNQLAKAANAANLTGKVGDRTYEQLLTELQELGHLMKASLRHVD